MSHFKHQNLSYCASLDGPYTVRLIVIVELNTILNTSMYTLSFFFHGIVIIILKINVSFSMSMEMAKIILYTQYET